MIGGTVHTLYNYSKLAETDRELCRGQEELRSRLDKENNVVVDMILSDPIMSKDPDLMSLARSLQELQSRINNIPHLSD